MLKYAPIPKNTYNDRRLSIDYKLGMSKSEQSELPVNNNYT